MTLPAAEGKLVTLKTTTPTSKNKKKCKWQNLISAWYHQKVQIHDKVKAGYTCSHNNFWVCFELHSKEEIYVHLTCMVGSSLISVVERVWQQSNTIVENPEKVKATSAHTTRNCPQVGASCCCWSYFFIPMESPSIMKESE